MELKRNIVLWCADAPNQKALAHKIHDQFGLKGIVAEQKGRDLKKKKKNLITRAFDVLRFRKIYYAWHGLQHFYKNKYPEWPDVPIHYTHSINTDEAYTFSKELNADLVAVSGTSLVKEKLLGLPARIGIINLHTGLSPYIKGGPNCTNWCIANNDWHLIGNTIMWINAGIDSGNIITTETIDIRQSKDLLDAHIRVMDHAHDLYLRAIGYLLKNDPPYVSMPQKELGEGLLFLNRMWTTEQKRKLLKNWNRRNSVTMKPYPKTISL
jgi:methionyl-tRNA formyltransferase